MNIASERRDKVDLFKKIFLYIKLAFMGIFSVIGSVYFVWHYYVNNLNVKYTPIVSDGIDDAEAAITMLGYMKHNVPLTISVIICSFIAISFVTFLVLHGIQTLGVRFMMRKANTGK